MYGEQEGVLAFTVELAGEWSAELPEQFDVCNYCVVNTDFPDCHESAYFT